MPIGPSSKWGLRWPEHLVHPGSRALGQHMAKPYCAMASMEFA
jgi:hypothetical protein